VAKLTRLANIRFHRPWLLSDTETVAEVTRDNMDPDPDSDVEIVLQPSVTYTQAFSAFETALEGYF